MHQTIPHAPLLIWVAMGIDKGKQQKNVQQE
jgi:hypothetical protein